MRVKAIYVKNLKMSEGKVASQIAHAVIGLGITDPRCTIIVLGVSRRKFREMVQREGVYCHADLGYTEVPQGEETCAAWIEDN